MNSGFIEAFSQIIRVKRVDKNTLVETIKASLVSAARRKLGQEAEIEVHLDEAKGQLEIFRVYKVVEEVEDEAVELLLEDARLIDEKAVIGSEVHEELTLEEFGRNAIQTAKQILTQKVREAERDRIYEEYKDKIGVIISGTVRQIDRGNILLNLGRAEAYLPMREQIRKERYNQGDTIRACVTEVDRETRGPQIIVSRAGNQFLFKLFEQEVPEIFDGDVEIKSIAREPGGRSKIAVYSRSDKVDAVGSCVGMKGSRVQAVVNELHGEKIDIVNWSETTNEFVSRALSPAKVSALRFNEAEGVVLAIVEDDQLSLAIGKDGQNVRLASKLTGWKINLTTVKEVEKRDKLEQRLQMDISEMVGVSAKMAQKLKSVGILTVQKLYKTTLEELLEVEGIGRKTAERVKVLASETMEELNKALEDLLEKEKEAEEEEASKPLFDEDSLAPEEEKKEEEPVMTEEALFGELAGEKKDKTSDSEMDEDDPDSEESSIDEPEDGSDEDFDDEQDDQSDDDFDDEPDDQSDDGSEDEPEFDDSEAADEDIDEEEPDEDTEK
ncbi:MAG: transcription termination/antitermination protein NusA [Candidatus Krumholzibacteriota bacterium]|nr:transcription termination/antitermination protein NusA [Candidatus Krumholzibacteriota bacterium]